MKSLKFCLGAFGVLSASVALASPGTFNSAVDSGNWGDAGTWTPGETADHMVPNEAGDAVKLTSAKIFVDGDYTVGTLETYAVKGDPANVLVADSDIVRTLTLDSGADGTTAQILRSLGSWDATKEFYIGANSATATDSLVLRLVSSLDIRNLTNSAEPLTFLGAKITGGTEDRPCSLIYTYAAGWGSSAGYILNAANDFRGDVVVASTSKRLSDGKPSDDCANLYLGYDSIAFADGMLGNAANEVILDSPMETKNVKLQVNKSSAGNPFNRTIRGLGTLNGTERYPTWSKTSALYLGPNCVIAPGSAAVAGKIAVVGSTVTLDPATTFKFTLGAETNDMILVTADSTFTFNGVVAFDYFGEASDIPGGTSFDIMTVSKGNFTFAPASFPAGYSYAVSGDANSGWTVSAIKSADYAMTQIQPATLIGDTFVTANANVSMPESGAVEATLRFYYGTVDCGESGDGWQGFVDVVEPVTAEGIVSAKIEGLTLGETYFVRSAVTSNGHTAFSKTSASFMTRALTDPGTYYWTAVNGDWEVAENWYTPDPIARQVPGCPGDKLMCDLQDTSGRAIYLKEDVSFGFIDQYINAQYNNTTRFYAFENDVTLTLDPGTAAETSLIRSVSSNPKVEFGNDKATNRLTVALAAPLRIYAPNEGNASQVYVYGKLTGGTEEKPCPIVIDAYNNYWRIAKLLLNNTANDFRGDIYVGAETASEGRCHLYTGNRIGDEVFGDLANRIILRGSAALTYCVTWGDNYTSVCNRTVLGTGFVRSGQELDDLDYNDSNTVYPLELGATSRFDPCGIDGTGYGTITFRAKSITCDPGTILTVDLAPEGEEGDKFVFKPNAGESVTLGGKLVVSPASVAAAKAGSTWTVVTVAPGSGGFVNNWKRPSGFTMTTTGSNEAGWAVTLTKRPSGATIIIR